MEHRSDLISHVVHFCRALRQEGLPVGPAETADALRALATVRVTDRDQVYWTFRTVLLSRVGEAEAFDRCFSRFWTSRPPAGSTESPRGPVQSRTVRPRFRRIETGPEDEDLEAPSVEVLRTGASPVELAAGRDLTVLRGDLLAEVSQIAARLLRSLPSRPGRRLRRHRRKGVPDLRSALRLSLGYGGELVEIPRRRRTPRVPRLLVLLDVSGSMDRHAGLLLQLVYALGQRTGRVETFVFSTSLTRVTRLLRAPSFSEVLAGVGSLVRHWSGGTRIGECLGALNREHAHLLDRGTSVFILSDGWDTGDPDQLAGELAALRRRVHRVIWLNPLLGTPDYAPLTQGLQAARPYVDTFASALNIAQLRRLPSLLRS